MPGECLDAETLAAWSDGALPAAEREQVELHLSDCARCQAMLAAFTRTEAVAAPVPQPTARRWPLAWLIPLGAAAAALVVWIAWPEQPSSARAGQAVARVEAPQGAAPAAAPPSQPPSAAAAPPPPPPATAPVPQRPSASAADAAAKAPSPTAVTVTGETPSAAPIEIVPQAAAAERAAPALGGGGRGGERAGAIAGEAGGVIGGTRDAVAALAAQQPRWRILSTGRVERSIDGGASWEPVAIDPPVIVTAGAAPSASVCWLVGRGGAVLLTTDGRNFQRLRFPEVTDLTGVQAASAARATVTTAEGRMFTTTDRGASWR